MNVMILQIIIGDEENQTARGMYFDVDKISGFYPGDPEYVDGEEVEPLFCFSQGHFIPFMPSTQLKAFLKDRFVTPTRKRNDHR